MPQTQLDLRTARNQLNEWSERLDSMPVAAPVLMIAIARTETPQPIILTGQELEPKQILNVLEVVRLQLRQRMAWDKVKGAFLGEE